MVAASSFITFWFAVKFLMGLGVRNPRVLPLFLLEPKGLMSLSVSSPKSSMLLAKMEDLEFALM